MEVKGVVPGLPIVRVLVYPVETAVDEPEAIFIEPF